MLMQHRLRSSLFARLLASRVSRLALILWLFSVSFVGGEEQDRPIPSHSNVPYGPHERNVLDFYQARSSQITPVLVFFHGGGFRGGSKGVSPSLHRLCIENGISCAAVSYRLSQHAPYPAQMHDGARAIQFLRSNASRWNVDSQRIAAIGNSAGAGIALWLATHDDLADVTSDDPIDRQSTRLSCAVGLHAQTTYDPREIKRVVPGNAYDHPALKQLFGLPLDWDWNKSDLPDTLSARLVDASPVAQLTEDDPPVFMCHHTSREESGEIHHANFGRLMKTKMRGLGIECVHIMSNDPADRNNVKSQDQAILNFVRKHFSND